MGLLCQAMGRFPSGLGSDNRTPSAAPSRRCSLKHLVLSVEYGKHIRGRVVPRRKDSLMFQHNRALHLCPRTCQYRSQQARSPERRIKARAVRSASLPAVTRGGRCQRPEPMGPGPAWCSWTGTDERQPSLSVWPRSRVAASRV